MKKLFSILTLLALTAFASGCSNTDEDNGTGGNGGNKNAFIEITELSVSETNAQFEFTPTNQEQEYCVFVVPKAEYNPSNIPNNAQTATGDFTASFSDLILATEYYVVAVDEYEGTTDKLSFNTKGNTDAGNHAPDFIIKDIPMKQKRSAKRGVSGNLQNAGDPALLGKGVCWSYNWGSNAPGNVAQMDAQGMTFYPMAWNGLSDAAVNNIKGYAATHPNAYILGFNEPNLTDQANMTPAACAPRWKTLVGQAKSTGLKLVSPALNYGTLAGYNDPEKWMDDFLAIDGVSKDDFEAIALHCYMPNVGGMRAMIHKFEKYNKPVWMTEFCYASGNISKDMNVQLGFMSNILNYLETEPMVEAYSWFIARGWEGINLISTTNELTVLGKMYVNFSTFDKTCYYVAGEPIPAAHYVKHNMSDAPISQEWATFAVQPTTDSFGELMLTASQPGAWVEYQLDLSQTRKYAMAVRYWASRVKGTFDISIDGNVVETVVFPKNEGWQTYWLEDLDLSAGKHTLRLTCKSGNTDFNWFYLD